MAQVFKLPKEVLPSCMVSVTERMEREGINVLTMLIVSSGGRDEVIAEAEEQLRKLRKGP